MAKKKFGIPDCPICKSNKDVEQQDFNILKGKLEQIFYCSDCDHTFAEEVNLLDKICPKFENWGNNPLTILAY